MRLSDVSGIAGIEVVRDGEFAALGLLSDRRDRVLVQLYDEKFATVITDNPSISCVITTRTLADRIAPQLGLGVCDDASVGFYAVHRHLMQSTEFYWRQFDSQIDASASVHPTAQLARKNVRVGANARIGANVVINDCTLIGERVVIRSGSVIGGEGFEPKWVGGKHIVVEHAGGVLIGNDVEIQSNCHVARALFGGFTRIGDGCKIDAMVNISHAVEIGRDCEIAACALIAGSSTIGDRVWIGPGSIISSGITIGDDALVSLGSVVVNDVAKGRRVTGNFAVDHAKFLAHFWKIASGRG